MHAKLRFPLLSYLVFFTMIFLLHGCDQKPDQVVGENSYNIIFLHHSTGMTVWKGSTGNYQKLKRFFGIDFAVPAWFRKYNQEKKTNYVIREQSFPKGDPYPWNNYPYDYYTIWVENAGMAAHNEEPTLEMLTKEYNMVIFKHCFPVTKIKDDNGSPDISSSEKKLENYKLQYMALKSKMNEFPETKFLVWTGAANVELKTNPKEAALAQEFANWVIAEWDVPNDNIFLWDFYGLETEGTLYLKDEYARNPQNSHPNYNFTGRIAPLLGQRIVDIIETNGSGTSLTGEKIQ